MEHFRVLGEVILREGFPYVDIYLKNVTPYAIADTIKVLEGEFTVYKKYSLFKEEEVIKEALIFSKKANKLLAAVQVDYEQSFFQEGLAKLTLAYAPSDEGMKILETLKENLTEFMLSRFRILLRILGRWKDVEYVVSPEEFTSCLIPELFYGIDAFKLTESFLKSPQNILLFFGKPGTGKSKLIQFIIGYSPYVYQKPVKVLVIKGEENVESSANNFSIYLENDIVVFDDLEFRSFKRGEDNGITDVISTILSVTDGFIPKKVKIIISTNRGFKEIDPALLRPNRLFDILELRDIPKTYFAKLCKMYPELRGGLKLFEEKEHATVSEILDFITRQNSHENYLLDEKISKRTENYTCKLGLV